jgi:hypothetical protein
MIVYSMNEKELSAEVMQDMDNVIRYIEANLNKFRRIVLKSTRFPVYSYHTYTSPRKNKWIIILEARNKKEFGKMCGVTYVVTYDTPHGIYAILYSILNGNPILFFYPPHFFKRFRERTGQDKSGMDLIKEFFKINVGVVNKIINKMIDDNTCMYEVIGTTDSGVCLGLITSERNVHFKTFITKEMLKGEQIDTFIMTDAIRQEVYG